MVSTPSAPDPYATAAAQTQMNTTAATTQNYLNNTNQITPYGSTNFTYKPGPGGVNQATATTQLSPQMQQLADSNIANSQGNSNLEGQLQQNAAATIAKPLDLGWSATEANLNKLNQNTLDPAWKTATDQNTQALYDRGLTPGSAAYDASMTNFNNSKSQAYNNMYLQGHQTAVNDLTAQYNSPINTLSALQSGSQITQPGIGQTAPTSQAGIQPANIAGMIQSNYQDQLAQSNAAMGGLFGLGGSLLGGAAKLATGGMFSDREDKTDIEKLGKDPETGLDSYAYRYKSDPKTYPKTVGPMAQDVEKRDPGAVRKIGGHRVVSARGLVGLGGRMAA
jgi:hypothetical protein